MNEQILQTAYRLFTTQGIQPFTMDDIASRMAISKKTLYRFFESRQDLVQQVCKRVEENYRQAMAEAENDAANNLLKLLGYLIANVRFCKKTDPAFFSDLQKHYPLQNTQLVNALNQAIHEKVLIVLEQGIMEGVFRGSLHPQLVVAILQQHSRKDFEFASELVNDYSKDEVFRQATYLFLYGIIAPNAIPQLEQELNKYSVTASSTLTQNSI
jgi:TetR/AcrR family transcriptional regulator, cholesterol catabolism regulator